MAFELAIFLAAMGITALELVEAAAVGLCLYTDSKKVAAFGFVALGNIAVLAPTLVVGELIALLPEVLVTLVGGTLLLYFGIKLIGSARKAVIKSKTICAQEEESLRGMMWTGFSVGAIEAFEAAIVLVALIPISFESTVLGLAVGVIIVVISTYILKTQVRKIKQANMKIVVAGLLLAFAAFWFGETFFNFTQTTPFWFSDWILIPFFAIFAYIVYKIANRPIPPTMVQAPKEPAETPGTPVK